MHRINVGTRVQQGLKNGEMASRRSAAQRSPAGHLRPTHPLPRGILERPARTHPASRRIVRARHPVHDLTSARGKKRRNNVDVPTRRSDV